MSVWLLGALGGSLWVEPWGEGQHAAEDAGEPSRAPLRAWLPVLGVGPPRPPRSGTRHLLVLFGR